MQGPVPLKLGRCYDSNSDYMGEFGESTGINFPVALHWFPYQYALNMEASVRLEERQGATVPFNWKYALGDNISLHPIIFDHGYIHSSNPYEDIPTNIKNTTIQHRDCRDNWKMGHWNIFYDNGLKRFYYHWGETITARELASK